MWTARESNQDHYFWIIIVTTTRIIIIYDNDTLPLTTRENNLNVSRSSKMLLALVVMRSI